MTFFLPSQYPCFVNNPSICCKHSASPLTHIPLPSLGKFTDVHIFLFLLFLSHVNSSTGGYQYSCLGFYVMFVIVFCLSGEYSNMQFKITIQKQKRFFCLNEKKNDKLLQFGPVPFCGYKPLVRKMLIDYDLTILLY